MTEGTPIDPEAVAQAASQRFLKIEELEMERAALLREAREMREENARLTAENAKLREVEAAARNIGTGRSDHYHATMESILGTDWRDFRAALAHGKEGQHENA